jgi:hypothetical protein
MAGLILSRRELRTQSDHAERAPAGLSDLSDTPTLREGAAKRKANAAVKVTKPRKRKRLRACELCGASTTGA